MMQTLQFIWYSYSMLLRIHLYSSIQHFRFTYCWYPKPIRVTAYCFVSLLAILLEIFDAYVAFLIVSYYKCADMCPVASGRWPCVTYLISGVLISCDVL